MSSGEIVPPSSLGNASESSRDPGSVAPVSYAFVDALRGIAAMLVLLFHLQVHVILDYPSKPIPPGSFSWWAFLGFFDLGKYAVVLFFLISGFLIPSTLRLPGATLGGFVRRRFFRLYPLYWLSMVFQLVAFGAMGTLGTVNWVHFAINLTMVQKFVGIPDFIGAFWTLQIEWTFYAIYAVLFSKRVLDRRLAHLWVFLTLALLCAALRWVTGKELPVALFLGLSTMVVGDILRCRNTGSGLPSEVPIALIALSLVLVPVCWLGYGQDWQRYVVTYWASVATFVACWQAAPGFERLGFAKRVFEFLGKISYGVYLLGATVLLWVGHGVYESTGNRGWATALVFSLSVTISWLAHCWIEKPAIAWGKRNRVAARSAA